jgi:cytochrome c553
VCGCDDLWRQKDFPQRVGLAMVALGAILSTIAWAYHMPATALGVLLGFALVDLVLFTVMKDVLVCYRCHARYGDVTFRDDQPRFNLETAERYRQEAARLEEARRGDSRRPAGSPP